MTRRHTLAALATILPLLATPGSAETVLGQDRRTALDLTITQQNLALVRDRRSVDLKSGEQALVVEPLPRQAQLAAGGLAGKGLTVREQQLDLAGIDAQGLLDAHRGKEVTVVWRAADGTEREERATILSSGGVPVFAVGGRVVAGRPDRVLYDTLPPGLRQSPAYRAAIAVDGDGPREVDLSYLTQGLGWQPSYVVEMSGDDAAMLSSWAELTNSSGGDFPQAKLRLVAGDLNADHPPPPRPMAAERAMLATALKARAPQADAQDLGPFHLYTLAQPVSLRDGETKQVPLLAPTRLAIKPGLELPPVPPGAWRDRWSDATAINPNTVLTWRNDSGQPLPAGPVRVFRRGGDGGLALAGQDQLTATPTSATVRLVLGKAFDVNGRRVQTDVQQISAEVVETSWEIHLANAGAKAVRVQVPAHFDGDWLILEESQPHVRPDARTAQWQVAVPANGESVLRYRARIRM